MMNQILSILVSASIALFSSGTIYSSYEPASVSACSEICERAEDHVSSRTTNSSGNEIINYESGVEVERISDDEWIIRDYSNVFQSPTPQKQSRSWITIGLAILAIVDGILNGCQTVQYVTGHDICRIVLSYITTPQGSGTFTYELTGNYIPGYIPGCEPAHSLPCNSGYWEYRVVRQ